MADERWLIVGLGNPGKKYERTFHNVGFMAIEYMVQKWGIPLDRVKFKGRYGMGRRAGQSLILLEPETYMNLSGESVREALDYYKIPNERLVVIYDDLDLAMGQIRIRKQGSAGTHNGMKSIVGQLGSEEFTRIRIGIGPKPARWDTVDYVLAEIPEEHQEAIFEALKLTAEAVDWMLDEDIDAAMNEIHRIQKKKRKELREAKRAEQQARLAAEREQLEKESTDDE